MHFFARATAIEICDEVILPSTSFLLSRAAASPLEAAKLYHWWAKILLCKTPAPTSYMFPKLAIDVTLPSCARRRHSLIAIEYSPTIYATKPLSKPCAYVDWALKKNTLMVSIAITFNRLPHS